MSEIINTNTIGSDRLVFARPAGSLDIFGQRDTPFTDDVIELSSKHKAQIEAFALLAANHYGDQSGAKEPTHAQTILETPTLIGRVDCTIVDGDIVPYEFEETPAGQGVSERLHTAIGSNGMKNVILRHYDAMLADIPRFIISGARTYGTDDAMIVGEDKYSFTAGEVSHAEPDEFVFVRTVTGDSASKDPYLQLQSRAIAPIATEGDKSYLERMGILQPIHSMDDLLRDDQGDLVSQVVKSRIGSMSRGVSLFLTNNDKRTYGAARAVTGSRLMNDTDKFITTGGGAFVQPFAPPFLLESGGRNVSGILRIFVLQGKIGEEAVNRAIGGCFVARPGAVIHGAGDAISGAVVVEGSK
ncbi:MAG: hypothetical protein WAO28_00370 [Candidatus Microsaccharimonas sp.]